MDASQGVLLSSALVGAGANGAPAWPELLGSAHWDGLIDPLDFSDATSARATLFSRTQFPAVGDISVAANLYATAATSLPPGLMVYSLSREAWSKESNWIGYVAVSTDAATAVTDQRVIYAALRGTIRNLEWVDVLKPDLVAPDTILLEGDPARGHVGVMKGWYVIYTSTDERSPFSSTTRATSSWPLCGNWSPSTSRAPIHISSGKKNLFRKAGC
ncbi:Phospholipase A1-II 5 [Hordeum vulgare]|nr:Phospholipase A1-II 5 [Hordeum vulgare]